MGERSEAPRVRDKEREYIVHWLREGRNFGWANIDRDLQLSVEVICE